MIEGLDMFAEFLHNLAPVAEEPRWTGLLWPNWACVRSVHECRYHILHSWDDALIAISLIVGIDLIGWSIRKLFNSVKEIF